MYVLDTNAFYYAAGIPERTYNIAKLQKLIEENKVFISSTTLFEFLIKFHDDIDTIHKGGKYLWLRLVVSSDIDVINHGNCTAIL